MNSEIPEVDSGIAKVATVIFVFHWFYDIVCLCLIFFNVNVGSDVPIL